MLCTKTVTFRFLFCCFEDNCSVRVMLAVMSIVVSWLKKNTQRDDLKVQSIIKLYGTVEFSQTGCCCDSQPPWPECRGSDVVSEGAGGGGMGGQMDEVITRISEHEGGAVDHCHHQANSWRQKPLQQLADFKHAHAQADALSPGELPSPVLGKKKRLWSLPQLDSYFTSSVC